MAGRVEAGSAAAANHKPLTNFEIYEPMVSTAVASTSFALSLLAKALAGSNTLSIGFAVITALPGCFHGTQLYTDWIPKMAFKMPKGELIRWWTGVPNVKRGLAGWANYSIHSNHFDDRIANALVALCKRLGFTTTADFECAGKGQYPQALRKAGINANGYDFSLASVEVCKELEYASLSQLDSEKQFDLVTSFEVMSKTLPGEEEAFAKKLINATKQGGKIVMSCAIPGQDGPNSNCQTNEAVIAIFERNGCKHRGDLSMELRRAANPMHIWLKRTIMAFDKL